MRKIDADALMERFRKEQMSMDEHGREFSSCFIGYGNNLSTAWDCVEDIVNSMPTIEERKTGKWIEKDGWDGDVYYDCSACGESWITIEGTPWNNDMNYCPHCGAKMEGE